MEMKGIRKILCYVAGGICTPSDAEFHGCSMDFFHVCICRQEEGVIIKEAVLTDERVLLDAVRVAMKTQFNAEDKVIQ